MYSCIYEFMYLYIYIFAYLYVYAGVRIAKCSSMSIKNVYNVDPISIA